MRKFIVTLYIIPLVVLGYLIISSFSYQDYQVKGVSDLSKPVLIEDEEKTVTCRSSADSLEVIYSDCNLKVYSEDIVKVPVSPKLEIGTYIKIIRAKPIYIRDGAEEQILVRTQLDKVIELLEELGIELGGKDKINHKKTELLQPLMRIEIDRYGSRKVDESEEIDYGTVREPDPDTPIGQSYIGEEGVPGEMIKTYKVFYKNNKEIRRKLLSEEIVREPVDQIVYYGTMPPVISTKYGDINYSYIGTCSTWYSTGDKLKITNPRTGKSTVVVVDCGGPNCGPFDGPAIDLDFSAFKEIEQLHWGVITNAKIEHLAY